ncbi:MAG: hypothetical protein BGO98_08045 [Myxococcales bacterium 68-20]|nr:MAG: hypothetical protein BGO98_08045 [Myxococcales bacterium 68-20]
MSRRTVHCAAALSMLSLANGGRAWADDAAPRRFGDRGQLVVTADRLMPLAGYTTQSITASDGDTTTKTTDSGASMAFLVGREPSLGTMHTVPRVALDYTFLRGLTVGASFALAFGIDGTHTEDRAPKVGPRTVRENTIPGATLLGFAPRFGYVLALPKNFAFWPRAGIAFYSMESQREETSNLGVTSTATVRDTVFSLDLDPQLVWTPLPNVLVHAGPIANIPLTGTHETAFAQGPEVKERSDDLTIFHFGISAGLGVWFDL